MKNTSINLYCIDFFIVIKKFAKNRQEFLHQSNISMVIDIQVKMKQHSPTREETQTTQNSNNFK